MPQIIFKHSLNHNIIDSIQLVNAAKSSKFISTGTQNGYLVLWSQHDSKNTETSVDYPVIVAFTGNSFDLPKGFNFVGTEQIGGLVYHVFVGPVVTKKARK